MYIKTPRPHGKSLKQAIQNPIVCRYSFYSCISYIEYFKGNPIGTIQTDDHEEEPPGRTRGEEIRVDATGVSEDEAKSGFQGWVGGFEGVEKSDKLEVGVYYEAEEEGVACERLVGW